MLALLKQAGSKSRGFYWTFAPNSPSLYLLLFTTTGCVSIGSAHPATSSPWMLPQRSEVSIDCCKLGEGHSTFLQQAAYITNGVYIRPSKPAALLEYLLVRALLQGVPALSSSPSHSHV